MIILHRFIAVFFITSIAAFENLIRTSELSRNIARDASASCLGAVKIRDGQTKRSVGSPLKFETSLQLSVVTDFACGSKYKIHYRWEVYKGSTVGKFDTEYSVNVTTNRMDFILHEHDLVAGKYVIKVLLTLRDVAADAWLIGSRDGVTWVEKQRTKAKVYIEGGNKIVMGSSSSTVFQLEAVSNIKSRPLYRWFCSISNSNLPSVGTSTIAVTSDTCLTSRATAWLVDSKRLSIVSSIMEPSDRYYFRMIVTAANYPPGIADIEVVPLKQTVPVVRIRCRKNCWTPATTANPLIVELYCPNCVDTNWTLNDQPLVTASKRFCKLNETELGRLRRGTQHKISVKGINKRGVEAEASFYFIVATPPSGGSCYAALADSSTIRYDVVCSGFKSTSDMALVYNFYSLKGGSQTLLQHGYDEVLGYVTGLQDHVTYVIEVCNETPACLEDRVSNLPGVDGPTLTVSEAVALYTATGDLPRFVQAMTSWPVTTSLNNNQLEQLFKKMKTALPLISVERALQTLFVINHVVSSSDVQEELREILLDVVRLCKMNRDNRHIRDIAATGVSAASASLLNLPSSVTDKLKDVLLITSFGRLALYDIIPGEKVTKFSTSNVEVYLKRATEDDDEIIVPGLKIRPLKVPGFRSSLNVELYSFDASLWKLDASQRQVGEVKSLTITSGEFPILDPISPEVLQALPIKFPLSYKAPTGYDFPLAVTSTCDVTKCNSVAKATFALRADGFSKDSLQGASLKIAVVETDDLITGALELRLDENNLENNIAKKVGSRDSAKLSIPTEQLPSSISSLLLTVSASLGPFYFRHGSMLNVKLRIYVISCMTWDVATGDWKSDKCKPNNDLECECSELSNDNLGEKYPYSISSTFFGVSFINVQPTGNNLHVPYSSWWQELIDNPVVVLVLVFLYTLYGLLYLWSKRKDRNVEKQGYYHEPLDNSPMGPSVYYITIYTGSRRYAGTTATVALTLVGTYKKSYVHIIQESGKRRFVRGSVVTLVIRTPSSLGDITAVRIWHNCEGKSPEWYLQRLVVREFDTNKCWFVFCNTWLGLVCDRIFTVADRRHLSAFRRIFRIKCDNCFRDRHTWYSMLAMRPWDQRAMSRVERLSSCLMTTLLVMVVAMIFHVDKVGKENAIMSLAYYSFKWSDVSIGLQSGAISFPAVIIVEFAFRWSRRFIKNFSRNDTVQEKESVNVKSITQFADLFTDSDVPEEGSQNSKKMSWKSEKTSLSTKYSDSDSATVTTIKPRRKKRRVYGGKLGVRRQSYPEPRKSRSRQYTSSTEDTAGADSFRGRGVTSAAHGRHTSYTSRRRGPSNAGAATGTDGVLGTRGTAYTGVPKRFLGTKGTEGVAGISNAANVVVSGSISGADIVNSNDESVESWVPTGFNVELFRRLDCNFTLGPRIQSSDSMEHLSWVNEVGRRPFPSSGLLSMRDDVDVLLKTDTMPTKRVNVLPSVIYYMTWTCIGIIAVTSSGVCLWAGATYGIEMCKEWLVSVLCAVLEAIFVLEPCKALLLAFIGSCLKRDVDIKDWFSPDMEPAVLRRHKHSLSKQLLLDEERLRDPAYRPPTEELMKEGAETRNRERQVKRRIKTVAIHVVYLALLLGASFGQRGKDLYDFGRAVESMLNGDLGQINARDDIYSWIEVSLGDIFTGGHVRYFTDDQFLLIATPRLRQKRVVKGLLCEHAASIKHWKLGNQGCEASFESTVEDNMTYKQDWTQPLMPNEPEDSSNTWAYTFSSSSWLGEYIGEFALYDPGGYYVDLPKNKSGVISFADALKRSKWIDQYTRLVMFETVAYNVAHRTYCVISLAIEINNIGSVYTRSIISLMRSHHIQSGSDVLATFCLYGILIMVFYHLLEIASKVTERRWAFFHSLWNCIHVTTLMTSVASVVMFLSRASYTDHALQAYFTNSDSFQLFRMAAQLDYVTRCLLSCCVFLTMVYTIKIMGGHHQFQLLHATLRRAQTEVYGHLMYIVFLYCAFCHVGVILFAETADFGSTIRTMQSVLGFSMEAFTASTLLDSYPIQGWFYLLIFFALFNKLFINFYATILENCYRESKLLLRDKITTENVISFGRKQLRSLFTIKEQRMQQMKDRAPEKYEQMITDVMDGTALVGDTHIPTNKRKSIS